MCLEYAHSCDILTIDGSEILPKIKRLNWEVLPPGEYPFKKLKELVEKNVNPHDKRSMTFILSRIQYLCEKKPIQICSGLGGFSGYFVYIFGKNTIVVDSCKYGNATYVLNDDWESVSKRTKKEILDAQLHKQRIIHSTKWQKEISKTSRIMLGMPIIV